MEQGKHYYAFISHSSKDEKIALWLCDKLNGYHIPTTVQKQYGTPKSIKPCFTFQTDLARDPVLKRSLEKELDDSQFLIVVCSPNSAKPTWVDGEVKHFVNNEVQHFIDTGRSDRIIPFIIEGIPHASNPDEECFCPALISLKGDAEPRGVNMKDLEKRLGNRMAAVVNVIASMLGVRFDVLWDKYRRRRIRTRIALGLTSFLLLFIGLYIWNFYRPVYHYYSDFVECHGVPLGICPITKDLVAERNYSYRFKYRYLKLFDRKRVLVKTECINSYGTPQKFDPYHFSVEGLLKDIYPIIELNYDPNKQIKSVSFLDEKRNVQYEYVYSSIHLKNGDSFIADIITPVRNNLEGMPSMEEKVNKANFRRIFYQTDSLGFVLALSYHSHNGNLNDSRTKNSHGVYGYSFELDTLHRITSAVALNENNNPMKNSHGINKTVVEYDGLSNVTSMKYYDIKDNRVKCDWGYYEINSKCDMYGNPIECCTYDEEGNLCVNSQGYAIEKHKFQKGCCIEDSCYDEFGNRVNGKEKAWKITRSYDQKGNCTKICYYNINNELERNDKGWSIAEYRYDNNHNIIEEQLFDEQHHPAISKDKGHALIKIKYDKYGRQKEGTSIGVNGEKIINKNGYCTEKRTYGKTGNVSLWETFDTQGNYVCNKQGYAIMKSDVFLDENGNQTVTYAFFDNEEKETVDKQSRTHRWEHVFDGSGNCIEERYYGIDNRLQINNSGFAIVKHNYDRQGRKTKSVYFDEKDDVTLNNKGYASDSVIYLSDSSFVVFYKNKNNVLCNGEADVAVIKKEFFGDTIITYYYDTLFKPCYNRDHYAKSKEVFDEYRRTILGLYYGTDSQLTLRFDSIAGFSYNYNRRGNIFETSFFDTNKKLKNNSQGAAKFIEIYDERDNVVESFAYDQNDNLVSKYGFSISKIKYDEMDREIESVCYDEENKICNCDYGFAITKTKHDLYGNIIETSYWDKDKLPATNRFQVHKLKYDYDTYNNCIRTTYFDTDNSFTLMSGCSIIEDQWNEKQEITQKKFFGLDSIYLGKQSITYNEYGFPYSIKQYDSNGMLMGEGLYVPMLFTNPNNPSPDNCFIVVEWGNWNITQQLNNYINSLSQSRVGLKYEITVMDYYNRIRTLKADEKDLIQLQTLPLTDYQSACAKYKDWKSEQ